MSAPFLCATSSILSLSSSYSLTVWNLVIRVVEDQSWVMFENDDEDEDEESEVDDVEQTKEAKLSKPDRPQQPPPARPPPVNRQAPATNTDNIPSHPIPSYASEFNWTSLFLRKYYTVNV